MNEIVICETHIRRDDEGRYCLNDLHRASGGKARHQPSNWLRMRQTRDMVAELEGAAIPQIRGIESKQGFGTFVCRELVYAYAMWISPAFALKVIRTYDSLMQAHLDKLNTLSARRARAELEWIEGKREASRCGFGL